MNYKIGEAVWLIDSPKVDRNLQNMKAEVVGIKNNRYDIVFDKDTAVRRTRLRGFKNLHGKFLTNKNPFIKN